MDMQVNLLRTALACGIVSLTTSACGVENSLEPQALAATESGPLLDPFITCAWNTGIDPLQNIGFTGYGYWGDKRGFRIHQGNYVDPAGLGGEYLEYKIEVIWSLPGCSGTVYYVRFPHHTVANHAEIEVRGAAGALKGKLVATKGSLPVLSNQAGIALPTTKLGPFVITSSMVGGANGMADTIAFTLLDAQILTRLPDPKLYNGALPASAGQEAVLASAYDDLVEDNAYLYEFFTFHRELGALSATERQVAFDAIDVAKDEPGPIHSDPLWEEHHHVDHAVAVAPAEVGVEFGGFWNGHRNMLSELERHLREQDDVPAFGRLPIWDSATTIPAEFAPGISPTRLGAAAGNLSGGLDLEVAYQASNICTNFASTLSVAPTHAERMAEEEVALYNDVNPWHGSVHISVGGDLAPFDTAANPPIFYPWHGLVDIIWRNWQLCEGAYHPKRYSWDAL